MVADSMTTSRMEEGRSRFALRALGALAVVFVLSLVGIAVPQGAAFAEQYLGEPYSSDDAGIATLAAEQSGTLYVTGTNNQNEARKLLGMVNTARSKAATPVPALKWDPALEKAAIQRAAETAVYYSHTRPDNSDCFTAITSGSFNAVGENIAVGYGSGNWFSTAAQVNDGWTKSQGHYTNMVHPAFTSMGAAVFQYNGAYFWVEMFGAPTSSMSAMAVVTGTHTYAVKAAPSKLALSMAGSLGGVKAKGSKVSLAVRNANKGWSLLSAGPVNANSFNWSSSNAKIATVNGSGVVTVAGVGNVAITAAAKDAGVVKASTSASIAFAKEGWVKSGSRWWYRNADGSYPRSTAKVIGGATYRFDSAGWMRTGWVKEANKWYYHNGSGAMVKGWAMVGRTWYYLDPLSGIMQTGWKSVGNSRYYLDGSGAMRTGWLKSGTSWYYLQGSGAMAKGWALVGRTWYYLDPSSGIMQTGWKNIGNSRYYLDGSGAMRTGWYKVSNKWYWSNSSGAMAKNRWIGGTYWVGSDGVMATNAWVDNGRYYVNGSGAWVPGKSKTPSASQTSVVYWPKTGNTYHTTICASMKNAKGYSTGTLAQAKAAGHTNKCKVCP